MYVFHIKIKWFLLVVWCYLGLGNLCLEECHLHFTFLWIKGWHEPTLRTGIVLPELSVCVDLQGLIPHFNFLQNFKYLFFVSPMLDLLVCITYCWSCEVVEVVGESIVKSPTNEETSGSLVVIMFSCVESLLSLSSECNLAFFLYMILKPSLEISVTEGDSSSLILFTDFSFVIGVCIVKVDTY